ncbi:uncharacterized protein FN964_006295 [Alca torda]
MSHSRGGGARSAAGRLWVQCPAGPAVGCSSGPGSAVLAGVLYFPRIPDFIEDGTVAFFTSFAVCCVQDAGSEGLSRTMSGLRRCPVSHLWKWMSVRAMMATASDPGMSR